MPELRFARCLPCVTLALALQVLGCADRAAQAAAPAPDLRYRMSCQPYAATLLCFRVDTVTGEVRRVDVGQLPLAAAARQPPRPVDGYQLQCDTALRGESRVLQCVRLDRHSGEMQHLNLNALPELALATGAPVAGAP